MALRLPPPWGLSLATTPTDIVLNAGCSPRDICAETGAPGERQRPKETSMAPDRDTQRERDRDMARWGVSLHSCPSRHWAPLPLAWYVLTTPNLVPARPRPGRPWPCPAVKPCQKSPCVCLCVAAHVNMACVDCCACPQAQGLGVFVCEVAGLLKAAHTASMNVTVGHVWRPAVRV